MNELILQPQRNTQPLLAWHMLQKVMAKKIKAYSFLNGLAEKNPPHSTPKPLPQANSSISISCCLICNPATSRAGPDPLHVTKGKWRSRLTSFLRSLKHTMHPARPPLTGATQHRVPILDLQQVEGRQCHPSADTNIETLQNISFSQFSASRKCCQKL